MQNDKCSVGCSRRGNNVENFDKAESLCNNRGKTKLNQKQGNRAGEMSETSELVYTTQHNIRI